MAVGSGLGTVIACPECDLLIADPVAPDGACVHCPRCDYTLFKERSLAFEKILALVATAMVMMVLANVFPIVGLNIQGHVIQATLFGAAMHLWDAEMYTLAGFVAASTIIVPTLELLAVVWVIYPLWHGRRPHGFTMIQRFLHFTHPWGMVEVFMLGVLVSLVKLSHLADILPGVGIVAYAVLMLLFTAISTNLDQRALWREWEGAMP